jgi:hypothetical protein
MNQNFREHARDTLETIYRDESRRVLATLIRLVGISIWRSRRSLVLINALVVTWPNSRLVGHLEIKSGTQATLSSTSCRVAAGTA